MASQQQSSSQSQSRSYYPVDLNPLLEQFGGNIGASYGNINNFLNNPLDSSMFKNTLGSMISSLLPSEEASRTALADQFRMAGGGQGGALQSGAFAKGVQQNERNILENRGRFVAQHANDTFRNILSGLGLQLNAAEAPSRLIGNIRPLSESSSSSSSSGSSQDPMQFLGFGGAGGGGGGGAGSFLGTTTGDLARMNALTANNPHFQGYSDYAGATVGPNYDPVESYYNQQQLNPLNFAGFSSGNLVSQPHTVRDNLDQWGYTPSEWASDPYYS